MEKNKAYNLANILLHHAELKSFQPNTIKRHKTITFYENRKNVTPCWTCPLFSNIILDQVTKFSNFFIVLKFKTLHLLVTENI